MGSSVEEIDSYGKYISILRKKHNNKVILAFSAAATEGKFNYYRLLANVDASVIFLNCPEEYYYHQGIPPFTDLDQTIAFLKSQIEELVGSTDEVVTVGCSMGGYGSLLYGSILQDAVVVALSPSCPIYTVRSVIASNRKYHVDLYNRVKSLIRASVNQKFLLFGGYARQDLASYVEFSRLFNCEAMMLQNISHQSIAPLINRYGMEKLVQLKSLSDFEDGFTYDLDKSSYLESLIEALYTYDIDLIRSIAMCYKDDILKDPIISLHVTKAYEAIGAEIDDYIEFFNKVIFEDSLVNVIKLKMVLENIDLVDLDTAASVLAKSARLAKNRNFLSAQEGKDIEDAIFTYFGSGMNPDLEERFLEYLVMTSLYSEYSEKLETISLFSRINIKAIRYVPDAMRDIALAFSKNRKEQVAYELLKIARLMRPSGELIEKRYQLLDKKLQAKEIL